MRVSFPLCFVLAAILTAACASGGGTRRVQGGEAGRPGATPKGSGVMLAEPAALFLAGFQKGPKPSLTSAEFATAHDGLWRAADGDGDGSIRALELLVWRRSWFGSDDGWPGPFHFDANTDGAISRQEFRSGLDSIFAAFDHNKDGIVERGELLTERFVPRGRTGAVPKPRERPDKSPGENPKPPAR